MIGKVPTFFIKIPICRYVLCMLTYIWGYYVTPVTPGRSTTYTSRFTGGHMSYIGVYISLNFANVYLRNLQVLVPCSRGLSAAARTEAATNRATWRRITAAVRSTSEYFNTSVVRSTLRTMAARATPTIGRFPWKVKRSGCSATRYL